MAFLEIINLPGILGTDVHSFKRANVYDKLDLGLAGVVGLIGLTVLLLNGFSSPITCVPAACSSEAGNANPNCALDWTYQSGQCKDEVLSIPDSNFHYLVTTLALLLIGLLTIPLYWGYQPGKELFDNFYYIWAKLKNGDEEVKEVEWKRRMHFVLDQLKNGKSLTTRYAIYHGVALLLDIISLILVVIYTLNFTEFGLDASLPPLDDPALGTNSTTWSGLFRASKSGVPGLGSTLASSPRSKCAGGAFVCDIPNRALFKWFGLVTSLVLVVKTIVNLKCLLFSLGLPGLFGRNFLIYADQLNDQAGEPIYNIQTNPVLVLLNTLAVVLHTVFLVPFLWLVAFCKFYTRKHDSPKEVVKRLSATNIRAEQKEAKKVEKEAKAPETEASGDDDAAAKNGDAKKEKPKKEEKAQAAPKEEKKKAEEEKEDAAKSTPLVPKPTQNWSDLFFILDSLSYNIDSCDLILFMTKINPIPGLENKKVSVDVSYLDTTTNTMVVSHTDAGTIETLLDTELATTGGLQVVGWLEGPTGIIWSQRTKENPKHLAFAVSLGSTYELVTAVYGRGRMLARLQNFTFQCPQDTKKQMKKYGHNVPLSAFISQSLFQKFSSDQGSQAKE